MRQATNRVNVTGKINSLKVREGVLKKDGVTKWVSMDFEVDVDNAAGEGKNLVTVSAFSSERKKDGNPNKIYISLMDIKDKYKTIETHGVDQATRVKITGGSISENMFPISETEIIEKIAKYNANFFHVATAADPDVAEFEVEIVVGSIIPEIKDEAETGRLIVNGAIVGYADKVDLVDFIVENPKAVQFFQNEVEPGATMSIRGDIRHSVVTTIEEVEQAFGDPIEKKRSRSVKERIITGGQRPFDADSTSAYALADIQAGLAKRETLKAETLKEYKDKNSGGGSSKPAGGKMF